ncbi:MAG: GH3 auxin-responsive promoter family protein [Crocinitomicaceae bacterium]|nr:GH3 auxin-responsive promoter family protein [Crocinitomicaceae bacterium]
MELIGKAIKETTRIGYKLTAIKPSKKNAQQETLRKLLTKAKNTSFGINHHFEDIVSITDCEYPFKSFVPITNYEQFHEKWLSRSLADEKNVTWPGRISYYALSSGTTNSPSKKIPVSEKMISEFQKTSIQQVYETHQLNLTRSFYESNILIIGGTTNLKKVGKHHEGDLSGILAKNTTFVTSQFIKPPKKISKILDWNEKMDAIIANAPFWDIGSIAGIPSWVSLLLHEIIKHYNLKDIHEIWPNLQVYSHGGIFLEPFKKKLEGFFGRKVYFQNTYLASEGYFAYQQCGNNNGMSLLESSGIYYEFIPEEYFEKVNEGDFNNVHTLGINSVQENTSYAVVISTCSGLWRYSLGDIIKFTNIKERTIEVIGRVSFSLNMVGEHLSDGNLQEAIERMGKDLYLSTSNYCVVPNFLENRHEWYISFHEDALTIKELITRLLDQTLKLLNDDYRSARKQTIKAPKVHIIPENRFYEFMEINNKIGGQNKFPRVMKGSQAREWKKFLYRS